MDAKKLTKEQRGEIQKKHFAVPETEQLPINDVTHTKMAWNMVDKTKGLSEQQRSRARRRILRRAHQLGMDTSGWNLKAEMLAEALTDPANSDLDNDFESLNEDEENKLKHLLKVEEKEHHMQFSGMAVSLPEQVADHPNKVPFSGVLTKLDQPSDAPLGGSEGKRVILSKIVAEKALASLLLMAIDFQDDLSGHDVTQKIGIIEEANIVGNEIKIKGFFYRADFPQEVKRIQAEKSRLGFSYEAQVRIRSMNDDPLVITDCVFTGAAVLYKDKAAYTSTSLTAKAEEKENEMDKEILAALAKMTEKFESVEARMSKIEVASSTQVQANSSIYGMVKPHVDKLHDAADGMEKAGIGLHPQHGHVMALRCMANHMLGEAAQGKMPHVYQTADFYTASADKKENDALKSLKDEIASLKTQLEDEKQARFNASASPDRKTITPEIKSLLANHNVDPAKDEKLAIQVVDKAFEAKGLSVQQRIAQKLLMHANGMLKEV